MKKVIVFLGTRPEAIKLAPVIEVLKSSKQFDTRVCSTGQHKEMLQQVLDFFNITVDYRMDVMEPNQQLAGLTAKVLVKANELLLSERPDMILVQGDTTTTFAASLAAFYNKIPILHIEAGLRTFNKFSPFPEEINRVFTTRIADMHYPPTEQSQKNLLGEGIPAEKILVTGNTVIDALFLGLKKIEQSVPTGIKDLKLEGLKDFILVTMHRRENHGEGIKNICNAIKRVCEDTQTPVIIPVHLNPNVKDDVYDILGNNKLVHLIPPAAYPEFLWLMNNSRLIMTDSGGVQEEAPSLGKPVLLLRDTTERPEAMEAGTVIKVASDSELIYREAVRLLTDKAAYDAMAMRLNPYGDGKASQRILDSMLSM
jgi:UDP-N-acetylglucosamine 2-epimerase (non-hydrolysing)